MGAGASYFRDKRVLVTGGSGFLGSHLVARLRSRAPLALIAPGRAEYDLRRAEDVARLFRDHAPDVVVHLAAVVGGIEANLASPGRFFYENLIMGAQVIEQARLSGVQKVVAVGTVCSYPRITPTPFREDSLWDGYPEPTNAPYGIAKKALLVQLLAYRRQYGLRGIFLIPTNLYGPGDNFDERSSHVIPALIRKCLEARLAHRERVVAWGSGEATREFLYVEDAAEAILGATERYDGPEPVNLGSGSEVSIRDLAGKIARATGFGGRFTWDSTRPDGQPRRVLDTSRARAGFGFAASTPLDAGLRRTVEWYLSTLSSHTPLSCAT